MENGDTMRATIQLLLLCPLVLFLIDDLGPGKYLFYRLLKVFCYTTTQWSFEAHKHLMLGFVLFVLSPFKPENSNEDE